jgi:hypothetical protein
MSNSKAIITIATGKKLYVEMACNLAMSFLLWNNVALINFYIITDCPEFVPQKLKEKISLVQISPGELGEGFSTKLNMYRFAFAKQNLFIDADCLVYGNLDSVFNSFAGRDVSVIGSKKYEGKNVGFCDDIASVLVKADIKYFTLLCGSVYYFEKGPVAESVFNYAKALLPSYHEIGLVSLRGKPNEEPLMAIAMAKFNQQPLNDTGLIKADRMFYKFIKTNVITGTAILWNKGMLPVPDYSTLTSASPLIVHFNAAYAELHEYQSEIIRLEQFFLKNRGITIANFCAAIFSVIPGETKVISKNILRPLYRLIFGFREIKPSSRM